MSDGRRILDYRVHEEDPLHGPFDKLILYVLMTASVAVIVIFVFLTTTFD